MFFFGQPFLITLLGLLPWIMLNVQGVQVPFCECILGSEVDCYNSTILSEAMAVLQDDSLSCLNDCTGSCVEAFYMLHTYHELCPNFGKEAGELYHDFGLSCQICDAGHFKEDVEDGVECPTVDCDDSDNQNSLLDFMLAPENGCMDRCQQSAFCQDTWYRLSAYHESCPEESLVLALTDSYHDLEENCPPECILPDRPHVNNNRSCDTMSTMDTEDHHDHEHDHDEEHNEHEHGHEEHDEHDHEEEESMGAPKHEEEHHDEHDHEEEHDEHEHDHEDEHHEHEHEEEGSMGVS
eukprot:TRINITY_DN2274_c0_g1_i12.p1 TRINITY_DN2274_c0_g1~~TRINITY_DN2274_c0_g1_i12.p1  ORF type:complete len:294 (+),score=39.39 TRINITY_DN2274_c0_g1_i12:84-965(+)